MCWRRRLGTIRSKKVYLSGKIDVLLFYSSIHKIRLLVLPFAGCVCFPGHRQSAAHVRCIVCDVKHLTQCLQFPICLVRYEVLTAMMRLMMDATSTSETSIDFYRTTRRNTTKDSQDLTAALMKITLLWLVAPCSLVYRCFRGNFCAHHQGNRNSWRNTVFSCIGVRREA